MLVSRCYESDLTPFYTFTSYVIDIRLLMRKIYYYCLLLLIIDVKNQKLFS